MAKRYKASFPFSVPMRILVPVETYVKGVSKQVFSIPENSSLIFGSFRTFGGSESTVNDVYTVVDTATIDTWYTPEIKANCRIYLCNTGEVYEIVATPENIGMRNQYLQLRVKKVGS